MRHARVVVLTSIMAPHRISLFDALAADPDLDVSFVYLARIDPSRDWDVHEDEMRFRRHLLRERTRIRRGSSYVHVTTGLVRLLREIRPDVLVAGGGISRRTSRRSACAICCDTGSSGGSRATCEIVDRHQHRCTV